MDKKKLTIIICVGILLVTLLGIVLASTMDKNDTDDNKQGQSVEQSEDEQEGLQESEEYEKTEDNSIDMSEILQENKTEGTGNADSDTKVTEQDKTGVKSEEKSEEKPSTGNGDTTEVEEQKYGEIIKP